MNDYQQWLNTRLHGLAARGSMVAAGIPIVLNIWETGMILHCWDIFCMQWIVVSQCALVGRE